MIEEHKLFKPNEHQDVVSSTGWVHDLAAAGEKGEKKVKLAIFNMCVLVCARPFVCLRAIVVIAQLLIIVNLPFAREGETAGDHNAQLWPVRLQHAASR